MACRKELMTGPAEVYWAPTGEAMPEPDAAPAGNWLLLGTLGSRNYGEEGISILLDLENSEINSLGSLDPECIVRTGRNMRVTMMLKDMSTSQLRVAFGFNAVTAVVGPPATNDLDLDHPIELTVVSIIIRSATKSPDLLGSEMQFEFENCVEIGSKDINLNKDDAAGVALEFRVLAGDNKFRAVSA